MNRKRYFSTWIVGLLALSALLIVACGGAAEPEPAAPAEPAAVGQPTATPVPDATATPAPTATPLAEDVSTAQDSIVLVVPEEPVNLNSFLSIGAALNASVTRSNLQDPLTWQSGDDLRIVPTGATTGWEQIDEDTWRFTLRQGVKFHNGEAFNADAALPSLTDNGSPASEGGSINYTGPHTSVKVDDYTVDINCQDACPIFPNTSFFLGFEAPEWLAATTEEDRAGTSIGFGPYKQVEWTPGVKITQEAYEDYVPAGDHFEFQKPKIQNVEWQWRGEPTVISAMVQAGEADIGWDVGVEQIEALSAEQLRFGSSAETYTLQIDTAWHPELRKKEVRQAIAHAVNCPELVDTLYAGLTTCRGNIIWPGIIGATEANTAPYEYNPELSRQLLQQANYNPENKITLISRGVRVAKQTEISEAVHAYLNDVGINFEFQIVEPSIRSARSKCAVGKALLDIIEESGRDPETTEATREDMVAAVDKGHASCEGFHMIGNQPSNETLDFGRQVRYYMNCTSTRSSVCDPAPGGIQDQIDEALASSGQERQDRLEVLADRFRDEVFMLPLFDLPVVYAVNPKLQWTPRLDPAIRVSGMWFEE
ncbi:MAG: hypothetical protein F4X65_07685 [Chloroflexi bacterium]|nr:hypothetical protein [Chloroflexota bacterium]